jgi:hypothetical protein
MIAETRLGDAAARSSFLRVCVLSLRDGAVTHEQKGHGVCSSRVARCCC